MYLTNKKSVNSESLGWGPEPSVINVRNISCLEGRLINLRSKDYAIIYDGWWKLVKLLDLSEPRKSDEVYLRWTKHERYHPIALVADQDQSEN